MIVIGYHGCSKAVGLNAILRKEPLVPKNKPYHWLGDGLYFWENDPHRALEWAVEKANRDELEEPFVIGAVIDLKKCLDLHVRENQVLLRAAYELLSETAKKSGEKLRENQTAPKDPRPDKVLRYRDCAVINHLISIYPEFSTVRGLFVEGDPIYEGANLFFKTHSEIAVRDPSCIKGLFIPDQPTLADIG
jgi:hypothetical protein